MQTTPTTKTNQNPNQQTESDKLSYITLVSINIKQALKTTEAAHVRKGVD